MDPLLSIKILLRLFFGKLHLASLATLSSENTAEREKAAGVMEGRLRQKESVNSHCPGVEVNAELIMLGIIYFLSQWFTKRWFFSPE